MVCCSYAGSAVADAMMVEEEPLAMLDDDDDDDDIAFDTATVSPQPWPPAVVVVAPAQVPMRRDLFYSAESFLVTAERPAALAAGEPSTTLPPPLPPPTSPFASLLPMWSEATADVAALWSPESPSVDELQPYVEPPPAVAASSVYAMAATLVIPQVHDRLPRLSGRSRFQGVKSTLPRSMFVWDANSPNPTMFILPSGACLALGVVIAASCLDEWLGREWSMKVYARHTPEECRTEICVQHRAVTFIPTITLRAKPLATSMASALSLCELRISGPIAMHTADEIESLEQATARIVKATLDQQRSKLNKSKVSRQLFEHR